MKEKVEFEKTVCSRAHSTSGLKSENVAHE
jgi:hypothetical protein